VTLLTGVVHQLLQLTKRAVFGLCVLVNSHFNAYVWLQNAHSAQCAAQLKGWLDAGNSAMFHDAAHSVS
jgi:hypothetical protein